MKVSGMMSNQNFGDLDRLRNRSPSAMASSNFMSNVAGTGLGGWNPQEVELLKFVTFAYTSILYYIDKQTDLGTLSLTGVKRGNIFFWGGGMKNLRGRIKRKVGERG